MQIGRELSRLVSQMQSGGVILPLPLYEISLAAIRGSRRDLLYHTGAAADAFLLNIYDLESGIFDSVRDHPEFQAIHQRVLDQTNKERKKLGWNPVDRI